MFCKIKTREIKKKKKKKKKKKQFKSKHLEKLYSPQIYLFYSPIQRYFFQIDLPVINVQFYQLFYEIYNFFINFTNSVDNSTQSE